MLLLSSCSHVSVAFIISPSVLNKLCVCVTGSAFGREMSGKCPAFEWSPGDAWPLVFLVPLVLYFIIIVVSYFPFHVIVFAVRKEPRQSGVNVSIVQLE